MMMGNRFSRRGSTATESPTGSLCQMKKKNAAEVPALELVLSEDSADAVNESSSSHPFDEPSRNSVGSLCSPKTAWEHDVHKCRSETCDACRKQAEPIFLKASEVQACDICRLPKRWWEKEDDNSGVMKIMTSLLSTLLDGPEDDIADDTAPSSAVEDKKASTKNMSPKRCFKRFFNGRDSVHDLSVEAAGLHGRNDSSFDGISAPFDEN